MDMQNRTKLLLFDLDDTLLRSDKTISRRTREALQACREQGILIGISTSRAVHNCIPFLRELEPDLIIASGGAVIRYRGDDIYAAEFTASQTRSMIHMARKICGSDCEITVDTLDAHYWNYKVDPNKVDATWGETIYTDFIDYSEKALKFCVEIFYLIITMISKVYNKKLISTISACDTIIFKISFQII